MFNKILLSALFDSGSQTVVIPSYFKFTRNIGIIED